MGSAWEVALRLGGEQKTCLECICTAKWRSSTGLLPAVEFHLVAGLRWRGLGWRKELQLRSEEGEPGSLFISSLRSPTPIHPCLLAAPALAKAGSCSGVGMVSRGARPAASDGHIAAGPERGGSRDCVCVCVCAPVSRDPCPLG